MQLLISEGYVIPLRVDEKYNGEFIVNTCSYVITNHNAPLMTYVHIISIQFISYDNDHGYIFTL